MLRVTTRFRTSRRWLWAEGAITTRSQSVRPPDVSEPRARMSCARWCCSPLKRGFATSRCCSVSVSRIIPKLASRTDHRYPSGLAGRHLCGRSSTRSSARLRSAEPMCAGARVTHHSLGRGCLSACLKPLHTGSSARIGWHAGCSACLRRVRNDATEDTIRPLTTALERRRWCKTRQGFAHSHSMRRLNHSSRGGGLPLPWASSLNSRLERGSGIQVSGGVPLEQLPRYILPTLASNKPHHLV